MIKHDYSGDNCGDLHKPVHKMWELFALIIIFSVVGIDL